MSELSFFNLIVTTIAPIIMGWYMYRKDHYKPEPLKALFITAFVGFLGGFLASLLTKVCVELPEIYSMEGPTATSEELSEVALVLGIGDLIMLVILAATVILNHSFDEQVDGIVYSVFIALGFILCQNIIFLLLNEHVIFQEDVLRALFLIPIYFFYAILSGYYVSRVCYRRPRWNWRLIYDLALLLIIPFLCQFLLVLFLINTEVNLLVWQGLLIFLFLTYVCFLVMSFGIQRIESHLARDRREGRV